MSKTWKKALALALTLCTVLSLSAPVAMAAENDTAAPGAYEFPEFGETILLGEPLLGEMSITEYALKIEKGGKEYLMCPAKGGTLYAFNLTDYVNGDNSQGTWIAASVNDRIGIPRGIVQDSKGFVYVIGDSNLVFCYDFATGNSYDIYVPNSKANGISIDENDNVYVSNYTSVVKIDTRNNNYVSELYDVSNIFSVAMANIVGDGYLYVQGPAKGKPSGCEIHKIDLATGQLAGKIELPNCGNLYYLSYVDGVLFGGHSAAHNEGMIAIDTKTMQKIDIGVDRWLMGVVTEPKNGKCYMQVNGLGIHEYDVATRKATRVDGLGAIAVNLRIRDPYLNMNYQGISGECIITMASSGAMPTLMSLEGKGFAQMEELVAEATSPASTRSIVGGIPGLLVNDPDDNTDNVLTVQKAEVACYIGAYLSGGVGRYSPDLEEKDQLENRVFSNGHAQTDSMITYKGKLYGGTYSGGYLWEYDPATGVFTELIHGLKGEPYEQGRIHGLSAGDDKIFFSSVPENSGGRLGGCIGWYDLKTGEWYCERNVVQDQIFISIQYDEKTGILYGASSTSGGTGSTPTQTEAVILAYDTKTKTKLGEFSVRAGVNPNSDMVFNLDDGAVIPRYISCVTQDPDTGKFWGLVSNTLFSFEYNRENNTMKIHEELAVGSNATNQKGRYPSGGSLHWFERPICFDGKGNMYISFEAVGYLRRVNTANPSDNVKISNKSSRIFCLGSDGNLYMGSGTELYTIALDRVSIVRNMIHHTEPRDLEGAAEARMAYEALTADEKAQLKEEDVKALAALEGAVKIFRQVAAERAVDAIDEIGAVTATTVGTLLNARRSYEALDEESRSMVTNYQDLLDAEAAYADISAKTVFNPGKKITMELNKKANDRVGTTGLQAITYDHITGGVWEYAMGSGSSGTMKFNSGTHVQMNFGSNGSYIGFRVKIPEAGAYDITAATLAYNGCLGGMYIFEDNGMSGDAFTTPILNEINLVSAYTESFIGFVDFTKDGTQAIGAWDCPAAGEYILVVSRLAAKDGNYGRLSQITLAKRNPVSDPMVEMAKDRINAIGKVTKKSGTAISDARITFDSLTEAQKALIYAPVLEKAEKLFAEIQASNTDDADAAAVALVQIQIDAIGEVTIGSGTAIKAAREAFDALSKKLQKKVQNAKKLQEAEAAYAALMADTGEADDGSMTTVIVIIVVVVLAVAGAVIAILLGKKKKNAPAPAEVEPSAEQTQE